MNRGNQPYSPEKKTLKIYYWRADNQVMSTTSKISKQAYLVGSNPKQKHPGWRDRSSYECLPELPVPIVITALWLAGVGVISASVMVLYLFWSALEGVLGA